MTSFGYKNLWIQSMLLAMVLLTMPRTTNAYGIEDNFITKYNFKDFGVHDITKCKWDAKGWLFTAVCSEQEAYHLDFFKLHGFEDRPKAGQVFVTYMERTVDKAFTQRSFTYILDALIYKLPESLDLSKEFFESDGQFLDHADQVLYIQLPDNQGIILRLLLSQILSHQIYKPNQERQNYLERSNLNKYEFRKEIIQIQFINENAPIQQLHQDDFLRFYYKDKDSVGILKIETIKRQDITAGQYKDFELTIGMNQGSIFDVNSRIMKQKEVIKSKLDDKDIETVVDEKIEAKEYSLVFTSQNRRRLNMIKFYVVKIDGEASVYRHDVQKYTFGSKFGEIAQIQMTENFLVSLHQKNQIAIFLTENLAHIGARQQKSEINFDAGLSLIEQRYRLMIIFAIKNSDGSQDIKSMMVYHTDATQVAGVPDLIIDTELNRPVQMNLKGIPNFKKTKVFSDSAIAWGDPENNQLIVRRIGTFRERFNILEGKIEQCESNAFTFSPNDISCTNCNDLNQNSRFEQNIKIDCDKFNGDDISEKILDIAAMPQVYKPIYPQNYVPEQLVPEEEKKPEPKPVEPEPVEPEPVEPEPVEPKPVIIPEPVEEPEPQPVPELIVDPIEPEPIVDPKPVEPKPGPVQEVLPVVEEEEFIIPNRPGPQRPQSIQKPQVAELNQNVGTVQEVQPEPIDVYTFEKVDNTLIIAVISGLILCMAVVIIAILCIRKKTMAEKKALADQDKKQKQKLQTAGKSDDKGVLQEFSRLSINSNHESVGGTSSIIQPKQPQDGNAGRAQAYQPFGTVSSVNMSAASLSNKEEGITPAASSQNVQMQSFKPSNFPDAQTDKINNIDDIILMEENVDKDDKVTEQKEENDTDKAEEQDEEQTPNK